MCRECLATSLDHNLIEVITKESYATGYNRKERSKEFCHEPNILDYMQL